MNRQFFENLLIGTVLYGEFYLLCCLSANDNGGIYLCSLVEDPKQKVALKIYRNDSNLPQQNDYKSIFNREFEMSRKIYHPRILSSTFFYEDDDFIAFSMPFSLVSKSTTSILFCAAANAIPLPIVPAPATQIFCIML